MKTQRLISIAVGLTTTLVFSYSFAQPGPGMECSGCQVGFATEQDLADVISDFTDVLPSQVMVMQGEGPNRFKVTLPDGSIFSVKPEGPVFRHQNMVQRRLLQTEEGGLHLRSQTRTELHLHSAMHQEADVVGEMLRLGWTNFYWKQHGMEVESAGGTRYCYQPDMQVFSQSAPAQTTVTQDDDGNLVVIHTDGIRQRLHACAHDFIQLRDRVQEQLQQQVVMGTDGMFNLEVDGEQRSFRLAAQLRWSNVLGQPEFVNEGDRVFLRYRDGWEQEVIELN